MLLVKETKDTRLNRGFAKRLPRPSLAEHVVHLPRAARADQLGCDHNITCIADSSTRNIRMALHHLFS